MPTARSASILPYLTRMMAQGTYVIPKVEFNSKSVTTNTTPTVAYRGAGRPEATAAIERAMDLFAAEIGMDPAEVRRVNLIPRDAFPFTGVTGTTYDVGDYERALDLALDGAGYDELRAEQARRREAGEPVQLGIGVALYVEVTAGPTAGQGVRQGRGGGRRLGHDLHRQLAARAGPRHRVRRPRQRRARASRWSTSASCTATPTSSTAARAPWARGRCSSGGRRCTRHRSAWSTRRASSPPTPSRPTPTTWCSTRSRGASTSSARRPSAGRGPSWPSPPAATAARWP